MLQGSSEFLRAPAFSKKKKENAAHPIVSIYLAFPGGSVVENPPAEGSGSVPGLGRSPGGGHGNPLQCSCLENPMDRGACGLQSTGPESDRSELACMHPSIPPPFIRLHADRERHRHRRISPGRLLWPHRPHGVAHACHRAACPSPELTPLSATGSVSDRG